MMPNITSSTPMLLPLMSGVTVVETILNITEKNTCPKRLTTSKPNCVGEMLMRVKENNFTITTKDRLMPHPAKPLSTVHPSHPTQPNEGDAYEGQGEQFIDYNHGAYAAPHKALEYSPPIVTPSYST